MTLRSGIGIVDLPVPPGTPLGGYADRVGGAGEPIDPLIVGAATFFDGRRRAALIVADVICANTDLVAAIRQALTDVDIAWVSATHTHSGPETGCVPGGTTSPPHWLHTLPALAREAVRRAIDAEAPGPISSTSVAVDGIAGIRSLGKITPVTVDVITLPRGHVAVLPVHPTVLPATSNAISADLTGALRRELAARSGLPTLVFTGAAGDISTRPARHGQDPAELRRLAARTADALLIAATRRAGFATADQAEQDPIRHAQRLLTLERRSTQDADLVRAEAEAEYRSAQAAGDLLAARIAETRRQGADIAQHGLDGPPLTVEVSVLTVGHGTTLVGLPGEPFLELAARIQDSRPDAIVLGYTNGYPGYLPTRDAYAQGGYESLVSVVHPGAGESLADSAIQLCEELR